MMIAHALSASGRRWRARVAPLGVVTLDSRVLSDDFTLVSRQCPTVLTYLCGDGEYAAIGAVTDAWLADDWLWACGTVVDDTLAGRMFSGILRPEVSFHIAHATRVGGDVVIHSGALTTIVAGTSSAWVDPQFYEMRDE